LPWPAFVKPAFEGSSKGVLAHSLVQNREQLAASVEEQYRAYRQPILVEEFIDGEELTVGVVGNRPPNVLGVMRVLPRQKQAGPFVYSLEMKRDWEQLLRYESPAQISATETAAVERATLACWRALGCRDVSRFDFRLRDGVPYFLEVNPLPGLSPKSGDLVMLARGYGIEHRELVARILDAALERTRTPQ
jgi:D-alanine-D-alanine ligase